MSTKKLARMSLFNDQYCYWAFLEYVYAIKTKIDDAILSAYFRWDGVCRHHTEFGARRFIKTAISGGYVTDAPWYLTQLGMAALIELRQIAEEDGFLNDTSIDGSDKNVQSR